MSKKAAKKAPSKRTRAKRASPKTKTKVQKATAEEEGKKVTERVPAPAPVVLARHEYAMQERAARGYSMRELDSAGISFIVAKNSKVPIDLRRRSVLEGNVAKLKGWYVPEPKKAKVETTPTEEKAERPPKKPAKPKKVSRAKKE